MRKLNLILYLSISLILFSCDNAVKTKTPISAKEKYENFINKNFNVKAEKVFLVPQIGCQPCLKQGANFLMDRLYDSIDNSSIVIITSDSAFYKNLISNEATYAKVIYDDKKILDSHFEVDISNMTFLDFKKKDFKPVFTYPGFRYETILIN